MKIIKRYLSINNTVWLILFFVPYFVRTEKINHTLDKANEIFIQPYSTFLALILLAAFFINTEYSRKLSIVKWFAPIAFWSILGLQNNGNWHILASQIASITIFLAFLLTIIFHETLIEYFQTPSVTNENKGLISDDPIEEDNENDSFGRKKYAENIVAEIRKTINKRAFNIAITGAWGSGKTSFLNLIKGDMQNHEKYKNKFITVKYNPWDFKEDKIIGLDLLKSISHELGNEKELQEKFKGLMVSLQGVDQSPWYKVIPNLLIGFTTEKSINDYREEIGKALQDQDKKLVIFLDDLDRLDGDEILEVFKTIRNSFDIANTFFILGFDIDYVVEQIKGKIKGEDGKALGYLDKIFQMLLNMPSNADFDFIEILEKETGIQINELAKIHCDAFFKLHYRDVIKVINGIKIFKAHTKSINDFDTSGLVMLEILKLKHPIIYSHFAYEFGYLLPKNYLRDYYSSYKYKNIDPSLSDLNIGLEVDKVLEAPLKYILSFILPELFNSKTFSLDYNKYFKFSLPKSFISITSLEKALNENDVTYFDDLIGTSKEFHLRQQLEIYILNLGTRDLNFSEFTTITLFKVNAAIIPSIVELATTHNKFIKTFDTHLKMPKLYMNKTFSHYIQDLEYNQKLFFAARYWFLDEEKNLALINEIIEKYKSNQNELVYIYSIISRAIGENNDSNLKERRDELIMIYKDKIRNCLNSFSLKWVTPFVFSISDSEHKNFSFLNWLFTSDELIQLLDRNDPRHAELIRWLGNEFIIGREYKFYFMDYEFIFEEKYYLYSYYHDDFL